jgi:hypothetical protein
MLMRLASWNIFLRYDTKVVHEQSGKVEYERERLLGIAKKFINLLDSQQAFRARIRLFRFARGQP